MTSTSFTRTAVQDDTAASVTTPDDATVVLRPITSNTWLAVQAGRIAGSIRLDGDYLAFDPEGMLVVTAHDIDEARDALNAAQSELLSYSTRPRSQRTKPGRVWRRSALSAALIAGSCGIALSLLH